MPNSLNAEERNLIDGSLTESASGRSFDNINPATEEVIGRTADATREEMDRAIAAARRAFDQTDWQTNAAFRAKCIRQLHEGLAAAKEDLRAIVVAEAGSPMLLAYSVQCDGSIDWLPHWADVATS